MAESFGSTVRERKTLSPSRGGSGPDGPETICATYGALQGSNVWVGDGVIVGTIVGTGDNVTVGTIVGVGEDVRLGTWVGTVAGIGVGVGVAVDEAVRADVGALVNGSRVEAGSLAQDTSVSRNSNTTVTMPNDLIAAY